MQGGVVRLQLAKILTGKEGVHFEHSTASGEGIRAVSHDDTLALSLFRFNMIVWMTMVLC